MAQHAQIKAIPLKILTGATGPKFSPTLSGLIINKPLIATTA
jgi:hypothetical protein